MNFSFEQFSRYIIYRIKQVLQHIIFQIVDSAPAFTNLPHKVVIYPSWVAGSVLYTVSVDDLDSQDVNSLQVTMSDDITGVFQFSRSTCKYIRLNRILNQQRLFYINSGSVVIPMNHKSMQVLTSH